VIGRLAAVAVLALTLTLSACGGNQPTSATKKKIKRKK
jgi:ABC-type glycerol-3-phosphate transport system substrate-binding protein